LLEPTIPATPVLARGHSASNQPSLAYPTPIPVQLTGYTSSYRTQLHPGAIIGFQIEVLDFDDAFDWQGGISGRGLPYTIYCIGGIFGFADKFVDGELIPCSVGDCSGGPSSAVRSDSWGRIKASFR